MAPSEFKAARHALGLSAEGLARVLGVATGRTIRRWEAGDQPIPGTVLVLVSLILKYPAARKMLGLTLKN